MRCSICGRKDCCGAQLVPEIDRLREALDSMPTVAISFRTRRELDEWNAWKRSTFNPDGTIRAALQEDTDE